MILKFFETGKINLNQDKLILLYGQNEGLKNDVLNNLVKNKKNIFKFEEKEIIDNSNYFLEEVNSNSLFENEKIILIKRATDKIIKIIKEIIELNLDNVNIIINAENLEKKSKLRSFFEKDKKCICIAFYPDNEQTLSVLANTFFKNKRISLSQSNINLIINKCNGDRQILTNELKKIEFFCKKGKKLTTENLIKIVNLAEDHNISQLVDCCLAKNEKKTINILNENNFDNEDCIIITRVFLNKSKKILKLSSLYEKNKNIDLVISEAKPPIFWKDKEITKQQIYNWKPKNIKNLIYKINDIEFSIKKNLNNSIKIITDFILEQCSTKTNN